MTVDPILAGGFVSLPDLMRARSRQHGEKLALSDGHRAISYAELDRRMDRVVAALQRDGLAKGDAVAICGATSTRYVEIFLGALRAGCAAAPLVSSSTAETLMAQIADSRAKILFLDDQAAHLLGSRLDQIAAVLVGLEGGGFGTPFETWLASSSIPPRPVDIQPDDPFNIIYSSGTTGTPKGIVQPHQMRFAQVTRAIYSPDAVTLLSTPLYSNTTLISLIPTLGAGGTAVLMPKFDALAFLTLSEQWRATHTILVPVQYRRLMDHPEFDRFDLSSYRMKFVTSAPFPAELKREVLDRWPGGLTEFYGMTEGGGTCMLKAHEHPDKLHTVGQPLPGHEVRLIDEHGAELPSTEIGEIVGRSNAMMVGYHHHPEKTAEAEYWSPEGDRYIRTGDLGRFDEDGFLILLGRSKDMIISGGFNIYPCDLEAELGLHPCVGDAAVVGAPSRDWGETPVGFVTLRTGMHASAEEIRAWVNARLGKTQRLSEVRILDFLPRNQIGKVLKRELREMCDGSAPMAASGRS